MVLQNHSGIGQDRSGCHIETKIHLKHLGSDASSESIVKNYHAVDFDSMCGFMMGLLQFGSNIYRYYTEIGVVFIQRNGK